MRLEQVNREDFLNLYTKIFSNLPEKRWVPPSQGQANQPGDSKGIAGIGLVINAATL
jgi:hypothetical protein